MFKNGRSFSELKQTCLELATLNIKLKPLIEGATAKGKVAYLLFNESKEKVEIFFSFYDKGVLLMKTAEGNWENSDYKLIAWKGYVIQKNGKVIFGGTGY